MSYICDTFHNNTLIYAMYTGSFTDETLEDIRLIIRPRDPDIGPPDRKKLLKRSFNGFRSISITLKRLR